MKFHLNYTPEKSSFQIHHHHSLFLIGSCFSEDIGAHLKNLKFKTLNNPNGILFNPLSIYHCLKNSIGNKTLDERFVLERENNFYSYLHHTAFHAPTQNALAQTANDITSQSHHALKTADILLITFGTAFYYHHKAIGETVANCHKQPAATFEKKLLELTEIVDVYSHLIKDLQDFNPTLKIIFTVSPVKHLKDGLIQNTISKSTLLLSIHKLIALHPHCSYFPAFELLNDDLRDHRFYKEDLAHPNQIAIEYIWEKFADTFFDSKTKTLNHEIQKLNQALNHRQMQQNSSESGGLADFILKQKNVIKKLDSGIEF